ncbi:hypothetical protein GGTG_04624 [Gaeumannomyces tritici R3-111a-1]|uniref:Uncharacterized protein n=1 Tax=Gaeumannomyces tritici (strain R3-111a-1) TaxID=644352 RepID=J3NTM4_GAET3|nr:hypothetical protein GGTG_04624 [Gaeumannomyces tritici R3-111a-1]EJT79539.1 hypothetical protein GGTG_04624 [Gaeumannomyces tritici R3-111a-1]
MNDGLYLQILAENKTSGRWATDAGISRQPKTMETSEVRSGKGEEEGAGGRAAEAREGRGKGEGRTRATSSCRGGKERTAVHTRYITVEMHKRKERPFLRLAARETTRPDARAQSRRLESFITKRSGWHVIKVWSGKCVCLVPAHPVGVTVTAVPCLISGRALNSTTTTPAKTCDRYPGTRPTLTHQVPVETHPPTPSASLPWRRRARALLRRTRPRLQEAFTEGSISLAPVHAWEV